MLIATGVMTCASMAPAMAADPPAEALKHSTVAAGYNITVTTKDNSDGGKEYNVDLKNDINLQGDDPDALVGISGSKGTIWATGSVTVGSGVDGSVVMDGTTATVSGLGNTTTAYAGFANGKGKAATEEQLKEISEVAENANQGWNLSTNGGEASKVAPGETVDFSGDQNINISNDGTKVKVELKNDINLAGDDPNAFVNISGSKGTIWASSSVTAGSVAVGTAKADGTTPFFVDSNGAFYAADSKFSVDKDGNANANSIQTNALNSKYNLSVGTANENGTVPFFVNSNGAFYAANGKLVVDKDGKVTATAGEIGNVVLQNGVYYGHSTLQDGSLLLTDDNGNHSYIDAKSAKLGKVTVAEDGKISGVAAGAVTADSTDAVNGSQLHAVATEAGKHSKVVNGSNINVEETDVDGQKIYKVNLNKDIMVGDVTGKYVSISGTNGTIEATGAIATKDRVYADKGAKLADIDVTGNKISNGASSIVLDGSNVKVNDKVTIDQNGNIAGVNSLQTNALNAKYNLSVGTANENGTVPFFVNSNGAFYAANGKLVVDKDGKLVAPEAELGKVTADEGVIGNVVLKDGVFYKNSALRDGELFIGDADGNYSQITTKGAKLGKVTVAEDGKISGVAAGAVTADSTDAVNGSQLHAVATEAGKHSKVVSGNNINVEETDVDGQKFYKVNMNKDIMLGDLTGKNVSISGTNGTIETTGYIATKDRVYADKGAKLADIDVTGNKISNGASSIVLDGSNVKVNDKVTIDQNGNIAGVNSLQTNALNAKYNLSVGTANENGTVPFFVNSNGAFYAANGKLVVDKDGKLVAPEAELGKVTADEGVIGNVVLKDGVFYKNSALRDGELFIGDADGNYSQITTKGAKLGKVTVAEDGKISGVAAGAVTADSTDAVNGSQLHAVATEAGKHSKVVSGNNINVEETDVDGQKFYKVNMNKDIMLGDLTGKNVSISGTNGTIETTGYIATKDRVYADKGAKLADIDVTGNKISNGASSIVLDGSNVKVNDKVTIDQNGNIAGVNSLQTNALNAKYNLSVGTANENGTVPFFVNSNGAFYAANGKLVVDKDGKLVAPEAELGKVTADEGVIGNVVLKDGVFYKNSALRDGELFIGDADGNYSQITTKGAKLGKVTVAEDGKISGVAAGAVTADSTDAVNGSQLHAVATEAGKHSKVVNGSNINVEETDVDGQKIYKVNLNKDIMVGDVTGKYVSISGTNGTIEATGAIATKDRVYADKGAKLADIDVTGNKISNGASSIVLDGSNVKVNDKVTIDQNGKISGVAAGEISKTSTDAINGSQLNQTNENVAALDKRVTDNETAIKNNADAIKKNADAIKNNIDAIKNNADAISGLNTRVDKVEALAGKHTTLTNGTNISVQETDVDGQKNYKVNMNKDIILGDLTGKNVNISGTNGTIETTGYIATKDRVYADKGAKLADIDVTGNKISNGASSIVLDGSNVKVNDKVTIDQNGKVTGVADGDVKENSKDAVNGSQLYKTNQEVVNNTNRINQLGSRVNKVGAGAAALAALHPMDFDPDDKLTFSAGYGNYAGENAAAIGAYYRPDEKVMFSVAGTVGNGENMVNAGVSFALDRTNHVSNSRTALAREVIDLRGQLAVMGAKMAKMEKAFGMLDETKTKLFPDVPANHWAYEYIAKLAGNGYIEGYPDGNFGGDRLMTRYEFAAMLYRAIENGAALEEKIIKEFEPELGRIRVDRISGEDGDRDKIERVRVNDTKGERDHYGNKLAK